jgi:DNA-binding MarR family transcriptional regulator
MISLDNEEDYNEAQRILGVEVRRDILTKLANHPGIQRNLLVKYIWKAHAQKYTKNTIKSYVDDMARSGLIVRRRKEGSKYAYLSISERGKRVLQIAENFDK